MLVTGWQQALTVLVIVIPGFVYQVVRSRLSGPTPEDGDLGVRVLRALMVSGLFALVYLVALGPILTMAMSRPESYLDHPRRTALLLLALVFVIPAAVAALQQARAARRLYPSLSWRNAFRTYDPTPTAWDFAVNRVGPGYVRVLTKDGNWVGGYAGTESFYTNYPQSREVFVETAWKLSEQGEFENPIAGSTGQWIKCGFWAHRTPVGRILVTASQKGARVMTKPDKTASNGDRWMPPRGGGYRPGKNTSASTPPARTSPPGPPPEGPAGASKSEARHGQ